MFLRPKPHSISLKSGVTSRRTPVLRWPTGLNPPSARRSFIVGSPGGGHWRTDLTDEPVKFFADLLVPDRLPARDEALAGCCHSPWPPPRGETSQGSLVSLAPVFHKRSFTNSRRGP